jgi:WD40 repeat protein
MSEYSAWDWGIGSRTVADLSECDCDVEWREENQVSPDGEEVAAVVKTGEAEFSVCVNGTCWEPRYERIWYLRYSPDGRLAGLACDGDWTLCVNGEPWEDTYSFLFNTLFSKDGSVIACCVADSMTYGMVIEGVVWETLFPNANNFVLSSNGKRSAAVVQTVPLGQADVFKFKDGAYSVAVDGMPWDVNFVNVWTPRFNADNTSVAAQIRHTLFDYTIVIDGKPWAENFNQVWEPLFHPVKNSVAAPVRLAGKWGMALDGKIIWQPTFFQVWQQQFSPSGDRLAAIVCPKYGRWTLAVDGTPWNTTFGDMVMDMTFSPDGKRLAALGKQDGKWTVFSDDRAWDSHYDMCYAPVFSPDSKHVAARVEKNGRFTIAVDGKDYGQGFDQCFDPTFSPDGSRILIRAIVDGKYQRIVESVAKIIG